VVIKLGRVRSTPAAVAYAAVAGIIVLWLQWAIWIPSLYAELTFDNVSSFLMNPSVMFDLMADINVDGTWSLGRSGREVGMVNGTPLFLIWIAEALIIIIASVIKPYAQAQKPYCENHDKWFKANNAMKLDLIENPRELIEGKEKMDEQAVGELSVVNSPDEMHHSIWLLFTCDGDDHYLTFDNMIGKMNDKKKVEFQRKPIVHLYRINTKMKDAILA